MDFQLSELIIRDAARSDIDTLLKFEQSLINAERPFDPTLKSETTYYDLNAMLIDDKVKLLVAEWNNRIIGTGYARIEKSKHFVKHSRHAYLGFMFVSPEYRGKGINTKLIDSLKQWAQKREITELRLEVYSDNVSALKAYERFGFSRLLIEMRCGI